MRFLGWRRDLPTIYAATDVFLLTSRNEGTPVALIEAMASGVPGVSTDVGGVKDVIVSDDVGARVPNGDRRRPGRADRPLPRAIPSCAGNPARAPGPPCSIASASIGWSTTSRALSRAAGAR